LTIQSADKPTDLPDGLFGSLSVQSPSQKYFCSLLTQITSWVPPSRPTEGRLAIVTDAGRDAMDAGGAADESAYLRTMKSCGPDASTPASSPAEATPLDDGDKNARSLGRARRKPLKPLRAGMPGDPGATVVTNSRAFYFCTRGCGCTGRPAFPTPSVGREIHARLGRITSRECGCAFEIRTTSLRAKRSNPALAN
jgi:hypothetical protein